MSGSAGGLSTDDRKSIFLVALKELDGNISAASKAADVARQTYYNWADSDEEFKLAVRAIQLDVTEQMLDEAEEVVKFALKRNDREVAKWVLSRLGKHRGYGTKVEVEHHGDGFKGLEFPDEPATVDEWNAKNAGESTSGESNSGS